MAPRTRTIEEPVIETVEQSAPKSLFQLLAEANARNTEAKQPTILGTSKDIFANSVSLLSGSIEGLAKGMELANSYISEELDRQVGSRTETKVDVTIQQFTAASRLVELGATVEEAINNATSYRL